MKMLGVQPLARLAEGSKAPSQSLLWRAVLELLMDTAGVEQERRSVGRIAAKCDTFLQYVRRAEDKLKMTLGLSDTEVTEQFSVLQQLHWRKLVAFYQFRALFALLIESIILTDRLLYLQESGVDNSSIVKLFNGNISPRCYAVMAIKD